MMKYIFLSLFFGIYTTILCAGVGGSAGGNNMQSYGVVSQSIQTVTLASSDNNLYETNTIILTDNIENASQEGYAVLLVNTVKIEDIVQQYFIDENSIFSLEEYGLSGEWSLVELSISE